MLLTISSKINAIKEFMKAGDYDAAVDIADKINPERVGSVRDLMTVANAYLKKHRYEDAKLVYIEMYSHAATHKVLVGLIELCLKTNSPEEADEYIREFRKLEPENPERLIYRYRVDVMLGKGPEYLVRSLSKLKDEDYSDVWGLELAKAYYKMEDYQKCAQECKDILLWFAGTDSAAKAHVLLGACAEKGVTISMPEIKPRRDEEFYDDEFTSDVPVIGGTTESRYTDSDEEIASTLPIKPENADSSEEADLEAIESLEESKSDRPATYEEEPVNATVDKAVEADEPVKVAESVKVAETVKLAEPVKAAKPSVQDYFEPEYGEEEESEEEDISEDDLFFDVSAAIGEAVSETIAEDRGYLESAEPLFHIEDEDIVPAPEVVAEPQTVDVSPTAALVVEAVQAEDEEAEENVTEATTEPEDIEEVPEDATETLTFLQYYREEETEETDAEEIPEDATVPIHLPEVTEDVEEPATEPVEAFEMTAEIDLIALALKKAKEADDDEDIVLKDYFPEESASEAIPSEETPVSTEAASTEEVPEATAPEGRPLEEAAPEVAASEEMVAEEAVTEAVTTNAAASEEATAKVTVEESSDEEAFWFDEEKATPEVTEIVPEYDVSEEELYLKFDEVKPEPTLFAETEEEDGQMTFFTRDKVAESVKLTFTPQDNDDTFDISSSIAAVVAEEMENGSKEPEVSTEPTKVHGDLTAQALDAILREDDEAIEKALYGLLSDK